MTYQVSNPINFYSGGDTTSQALGKHIAEIARIYEILNSMSAGGATIVTSGGTVLKAGEIGFDRITGALKIGDGVTPWDALTGISVVEIVDALTSSDATKALSAAQGKALKDLIDAIPVVEIVDNLTVGGTTKALSAEQGKVLKALVDTLETPVPGPPGPRGIEWRGAWDGATEYRKGDAVSYQGSSHIALQPSMGKVPPDAGFWDLLSAKGQDGADGQGAGDMTRAVYDSDGDGKVSFAEQADSAGAVPWDGITGKPPSFGPEIIDVLDSDRTDAALSAAQGKVLKGAVDEKAASVHQHEEGDITGLSAALTDKAPKIHQHQISDVVNLAEQLASSGGLSVIDLSQDPNFLKPEMQIDSTAPVIAIPELGIFRYDAASTEIIDGETCLATKSGVGRYLLLVPDASWLSMVAIRDARRLMELNRREVITTTIALPSMTVPANGLASRDVACHEVELGDSVEILTLVPLAGNIAVYGLVGSLGVIRMVVMNSNQGQVSTPNMVLVIKINKEASV